MTNKKWLFWLALTVTFFLFLYGIHTILLPFVLGMFFAYFLDPAADKLETWGFSRTLATLTIIGCFFVCVGALSVLVVPLLAQQLAGLIAAWPDYIREFNERFAPELSRWLGGLPAQQMNSLQAAAHDFSGAVAGLMGGFIGKLFQSGMAIVTLLSLILITPVVSFYLLRDWDRMIEHLDGLLPREHAQTIRTQARIIDRTLAGFVRGQLNVCLILATFYAIALSLAGLKFGIVIGIATGFLFIIPYAGFALGLVIGMGAAFFQFDTYEQILTVFAIFMAGQSMESYFLTPKLVGDQVGLHPIWIIFGMLSGAALFGFVGVLLAVPLTAVVGVLTRFMTERYLESEYYRGAKRKM